MNNTLYQVWSKEFNDEKFCFNAKTVEEANNKLRKWTIYHSMDNRGFFLNEVNTPKYSNNIHNEWVN